MGDDHEIERGSTDGRPEMDEQEFRELFKAGLADNLDAYLEMFGDTEVVPVDTATVGVDTREFIDLSAGEINIIRKLLFEHYGLDPEDLASSFHREYSGVAPDEAHVPGPLRVQIYKTNGANFIHIVIYADDSVCYMVGADVDV